MGITGKMKLGDSRQAFNQSVVGVGSYEPQKTVLMEAWGVSSRRPYNTHTT